MKLTSTLAGLALSLLAALPAQAQLSVQVTDTLLMTDPNPTDLPSAHAVLTNIGSTTARVVVYRTIESLPSGQSTYFCFSVGCYAPNTDRSQDTLTLAAGADDHSFTAYLNPSGIEGVSSVRYDFVDVSTGNTARVRFRFNSAVTSVREAAALRSLVAGALPATGTLRLHGGAGVSVRLQDMTGRVVRTAQLANRSSEMDIHGLPAGTYTLSASDGRSVRVAIQ